MKHTSPQDAGRDAGMSCDQVASQLAAYMNGTLSPEDSSRLEWHAASCGTCEALLEQATMRPASYAPTSFAPELPDTLKAQVLAAVDGQWQQQAGRVQRMRVWRRSAMVATLAAAAVLVIAVMTRGRGSVGDAPMVADSGRVGNSSTMVMSNVMHEAESMATTQAASEFSALDAAMQELDAALAATPDDAELRRYRSTIRTRRDELERRVRDAAS
ncbi:MAG TPA: zf-HC2 domain-containing protein [Gemmatimonas sp.]|uniref:zf-HC2 domain-containing protein n=1 Tax=Gemmatimonas sp. TaxID=1962908 RepID=UPI002ED9C134